MIELHGRSKKDQVLFNQFLRMPFEYFKFINHIYPKNFSAAPYHLGAHINTVNKLLGGHLVNNIETIKLKHGGIPPQHIGTERTVTGKKEILDTLNSLTDHFDKFMQSGVTLYLHSPFEGSAISAGVQLCKRAAATNVSWKMESYPELLIMLKDFDGDHKSSLEAVIDSDLLCLYMVGKEYPTEFTVSYFKQLMETRKIAGRATIICSHLEPTEFTERYGKGINLCAMEFTDDAEINNFKALRRLVEG
jgi:hypothetical protein